MAQWPMWDDYERVIIVTDSRARLRWRVSERQARGANLARITNDSSFEAEHYKKFARLWLPDLAQAHGW